jgi:hypothetical protein
VDNVIKEQCRQLAAMLYSRPTDARRLAVDRALGSKWEGVQVWAGRVLATWGDRRSIDTLRRWLAHSLEKEAGWALRGQAIRSLCECYEPKDIPWMLELYFSADTHEHLHQWELLRFVQELPIESIRERIAVERGSDIASRRAAAEVAARVVEWRVSLEARTERKSTAVRKIAKDGRKPTPTRRKRQSG